MLKPTVSTLYQSASDSGITFELNDTPTLTLEVNYSNLTSNEPLSRQQLNELELEFRAQIEPHRRELTDFLIERKIIMELNRLLSSKAIDEMNYPLLIEAQEKITKLMSQ